jgi:carbonic anhydrase
MVMKLLEGHERFRREHFERDRELFESLAKGAQHPLALFIGCCDARVVPHLILGAQPGDLFVVRNIANVVPPFEEGQVLNRSVGAAIEFAVHFLRVPHIVVCGHTQCGGLGALIDQPAGLAETPTLAAWLRDSAAVLGRLRTRDVPRDRLLRQLVFENVVVQLENLLTYPVVARALDADELELHGWVYDVADATLRRYHPETNEFRPVSR